ncbi:tape measure protein [Planctomyces sp. SH-PL14]|uniref:tape measure protein n=1 Tax=Planctomyces sp. SH-PL14 TaxID=1632864 RepID=UPI00078EEB7F|nr:tape measure protein [Planctomyces sp. SH-PL14]AMV20572.1 hypothetical protein VT03_21920 [Planctomyces sp. SH-PL14]
MSTSFRAMTGVLSIQIDSFKRGLTEAGYSVERLKVQASAAFRAIDVAADKASDGVEESSKKMREAVKKAAEGFTAAVRAVDPAVVGMSTTVGRFMFDTAVSVGKMGFELLKLRDNALLSFTALTGSAERAKILLRDLESFAASTPFELPGLVASAQKSIGFGVKAEEVIPILRSLGNAAVGVGGSPEQVDRMVAALGAMKAAGQVTTDQMQALQETGVPAWETLAQVIGRSVQETQRLTEQGVVKTDLVFDAFVAALGNRFAGLMDKQSQTLGGMIGNLAKTFQGEAATIFQPLYGAATNFLIWAQGENGINLDGITGRLQAVIARVAAALDSFLRANGVAKHLHIPMVPIETCLGMIARPYRPSVSRKLRETGRGRVLVIDDSVNSGKTCDEIGSRIRVPHYRAAAIVTEVGKSRVDFWGAALGNPHCFHWQWLACVHARRFVLDMDGVICEDWSGDWREKDAERYAEFLENARPLHLPRVPVMAIVTGRLERFRPQTEAWLRRHGVEYGTLLMNPGERKHAEFKADAYGSLGGALCFVESNRQQAAEIHERTGRPVLSVETWEMLGAAPLSLPPRIGMVPHAEKIA